jgi:hypothetical protein
VSLSYTLQPFDADRASIYLAGMVELLEPLSDEQPLFVSRVLPRPERPTGYNEIFIGGQWPGAWVMAGVGDSALSEGPATEADVEALLRSLRPATGDEWRTFLDTATDSVDDDARTDRLSDLIVQEGEVVPGLGDEPSDTTETSPGTPAVDITTDGPDAPNTRLIAVAKSLAAGQGPFPVDDLFAPSVAIGLDFETVRTVGRPNLSDPVAWVIDDDDVEYYAGHTPPFSALQLLADTGAFATVDGPTEGCAEPTPTPPPTGEGQRLVTITPGDIDSCIQWFAVTLVLDEQDRIAGVHLYLREP